MVPEKKSKPMLCRLNLKHTWRTYSTDDGRGRWKACGRCGKDKDTSNGIDVPLMH